MSYLCVMTTWLEEFNSVFGKAGDTWEDLETTFEDGEAWEEFDPDFGHVQGKSFTAWSKDWVYFPVKYDGAEWIERVPRNPCDIKTNHVGGG